MSKGRIDRPAVKGEVYIRPATAREFRKIRKLSQAGLAAKATLVLQDATGDPEAGISESLIALIETGRRQPSLRNAEAIATALDIPVEALAEVRTAEAIAEMRTAADVEAIAS